MMLMAIVVKILLGIIIAALLAQGLIAILVRVGGGSETLYTEDQPGWRSYVTFKPLPRFEDTALRPAPPYRSAVFHELCERLRVRGVDITEIKDVASAQRATVRYDGQTWDLTAGIFKRRPEQWLLTIDQRFSHGTSAPHDTPASRAFLMLMREILEGMDISTVRWHPRQQWNRGKVDVWAYKPF